MKTILLLRHAKSSWENSDLADFDRPLNKRGLNDAPRVGEKIFENKFSIDLIVSSPARRAAQTAILVKETAQIKGDIQYDERIYEASPLRLLKIVSETEENKAAIMLVGHNPGIEGFIKTLTGETRTMPTAALAIIDLSIVRWLELSAGGGKLRKFIFPKE